MAEHAPGWAAPFSAAEVLDALGQAVIATDVNGSVVYWNPAAEVLYDWTAQEALGRPIEQLTVPQMSQAMADDIMSALGRDVPWSGGFLVRHRDGRVFPALVTDSGIHRGGSLVGIVGISANLGTAMRPLLERSTDAAVLVRADGLVGYASPAVGPLFGWDDTTLSGAPFVPLVHPDDRGALAEFLTQVARRPGGYAPLELRVQHADGSWVWVEAALTNLLDDPLVRGVVCNLHRSLTRATRERSEERIAQLEGALRSRVLIEQAKGFLAGRDGGTPEDAFQRMRRYARAHDLTVREVAQRALDGDQPLPL